MEGLFILLRSIAPMSADLEAHLRSILVHYHFRKGDILLKMGQMAENIYYIEKGLVRSYHVLNREEISNWFMKEKDICISVVSFFGRRASTDNIRALEDCEFWGICYSQLEQTYALFPEFERHGRIIAIQYYVRSQIRDQDNRRQAPEDKYAKLLESDPGLVRRVPKKYLASFLNISGRTFSRILKEYKARKSSDCKREQKNKEKARKMK